MELLKDYDNDFIYRFVTTKDNCVIICYYKYNTYSTSRYSEAEVKTLTEETEKAINIEFIECLQGRKENTSQTVVKRCHADLYGIDRFNNDIVDYLNKRPNVNEVFLISGNQEYQILFEPKVFQAMCKNSKRITIEIGEGGFRTDSTQFDNIERIEFIDGTWLVGEDTTVTVKDLVIRNGIINTYNKSDKVSNTLNLIIGNSLTGSRFSIYSTVRCSIQYSSTVFNTSYGESRVKLPIVQFFGQETTETDINDHRLSIFGFNRLNIGDIIINDEVQYGNLLKLNNINIAVICGIKRRVTGTNRPGSVILVEEVGEFKVHNIQYLTDVKSFVYEDSSIIKMITKDSSQLKKSFQIYDTTVVNNSTNKITILDIVNTEVELLYLADCVIGPNVNIFRQNEESKIKRISYSGVQMVCDGSVTFNQITEMSLYECTFEIKNIMSTDLPKLAIMDSTIKFDKLNIDYTDGNVPKCTINNSQLIGGRLQLFNNSEVDESKTTITDSKLFVDTILIDNYTVTLTGGMIKSKKFTSRGKSITFDSTVFSFYEASKKAEIFIDASTTGKIVLDDYDDTNEMDIVINDQQFYFNTSSLDIIAYLQNPKLRISTNTPMNVIIERLSTDSINFKLSGNYDSERKCKITKHLDSNNPTQDFKVINDSELYADVTKSSDNLGNTIFEVGLKETA